ncbi:MAG: hypothetical protein R3C61_13590 [Bacteroidia bacterium]
MKQILVFLIVLLAGFSMLEGQVPRFAKYPVMASGASLYMPQEPEWQLSYSEDSSEVYTTEVSLDTVLFGAIVVKFAEDLGEDTLVWENLLMSYLEYLNSPSAFGFSNVTDPGYGHQLSSHPKARGILEYAEDEAGTQYSLKGWIDNQYLAILFLGYPREINYNIEQMYLGGFRFP